MTVTQAPNALNVLICTTCILMLLTGDSDLLGTKRGDALVAFALPR